MSMLSAELLECKLISDKVTILDKKQERDIVMLTIDKLPEQLSELSSNRRKFYLYSPFIIKSCDREKFEFANLSDLDEIKLEITSAKNFSHLVPILNKTAILHCQNAVFLVEPLLIPFEEFSKDSNLLTRAIEIENKANIIFKAGDFKKGNLVYDEKTDLLLFTDVFPSSRHLISTP